MKTVGLVLGSGGARGLAHIGVIRALEEANIKVDCIAGASIGALVGAIYAANELDDFEAFVCALDWRAIVTYFDIVFPRSGLLEGDRIYELLSEHLKAIAIEDTDIRFCCVATDLVTSQEVRLQSGPMVDAVRASISIPGVFTPFTKADQCLGDGGIVNPVPVDVMRDMGADVVIAVNLNNPTAVSLQEPKRDRDEPTEREPADAPGSSTGKSPEPSAASRDDGCPSESADADDASSPLPFLPSQSYADLQANFSTARERVAGFLGKIQKRYETMQGSVQEKLENWLPEQKQTMNIFDVIGVSLNVMEQQVARSKLEVCPPDILLEPGLSQYGIFDFHQAAAIIEEGYRCMAKRIPEVRQKLQEESTGP